MSNPTPDRLNAAALALYKACKAAFEALHVNWDILGGNGDAASLHANELLTAAINLAERSPHAQDAPV